MRLTDIAESLDLPDIRAAEGAWDLARARVRRRRRAAALGVAGVVALALVLVPLTRGQREAAPPVSPPTPTTTVTTPGFPLPSGDVVPPEVVTPRLKPADYPALTAGTPRLEVTDPVPMSEIPVEHAQLAVVPNVVTSPDGAARWTNIFVLGDDGRWRSVDVPGLVPATDAGGYEWFPLAPTSLNSSGTSLALAQPHALVVVDLTTGEYRRYGVPGFNKDPVWRDDSHVLVSTEEQAGSRVVDLETGDVTETRIDPTTRFLTDGTWVSWPDGGTLDTNDGRVDTATVGNDVGAHSTVPLADDRVVVGLRSFFRKIGDVDYHSDLGAVVVDRHNGNVLGVWPSMRGNVDVTQLLALEDGKVLMSIVQPDSLDRLLVEWHWADQRIEVVAVLDAAMASWAGTF